MMKLSTMKKVVGTVTNEWRSPLAEEILTRWGYDKGSVYYVRASANFIFVFKSEGKTYYLRFNDSNERGFQSIESELNLVRALGISSLHIAKPVKSLDNKYVEIINTEFGTFHGVVFEGLQGKHIDIEELTDEQVYRWGEALGQLHKNLKTLNHSYPQQRPSWREHLLQVIEILPPQETAAYIELERITQWADGLSLTKDNFGLIHYDFELDNLKFESDSMGILDFDDCSRNWYVADIIYALRDFGDFNLELPFVKIFLNGYESITTLDRDLLQEHNGFVRMHKLITFAKLLRTVDIETTEDDPVWLINLHKKLNKMIDEYRLSFER